MNAIHHGRVPEYQDGIDPLIYLVTTVERLAELGLAMVFTDRNAALISSMVTFSSTIPDLDTLVDWNLMQQKMWNNTLDDPDRRDRRMAECLVHRLVPWAAVLKVVARTPERSEEARALLAGAGVEATVDVRSNWYF